MKMKPTFFLILCSLFAIQNVVSKELKGDIIGTFTGYDYSTGKKSSTVNTAKNVFDENLNTYFASNLLSKGWVGVDLGTPCKITRIGWAPAHEQNGPKKTILGIFEVANNADFSDAIPIQIIKNAPQPNRFNYITIKTNGAFRYIRYIGPEGSRCLIAELRIWGEESSDIGDQFYQVTDLPTVVINTNNGIDPTDKVNEIPCLVTIISDEGQSFSQHPGTTRLRGNASMNFPKKPYRIKYEEKWRVLDSPARAKKWTLINNYGDKTLMRNILAFEISKRLGIGFTPFCRPVDVIFNGDYKGCYQLCDQLDIRKNRIDIHEMTPDDIEGEALTGGYLLEVDGYATKEPKYFISSRKTPVNIRYPDPDDITSEQYTYIRTYYEEFEESFYKIGVWQDSLKGYRKYLNLPSFHRHFLVGELSGNTDTYWSTYMSKDRNQSQFFVEPVWDFDIAFDNDYRTYPICNRGDYIYRSGGSHAGEFNKFVDRILIYDKKALNDLQSMWAYARRKQDITVESLHAFIDSIANLLDESQTLNFTRWPILSTKEHMNHSALGSYANEVQALKNYISDRIAWMDNKLKYNPDDYSDEDDIQFILDNLKDNINVWNNFLVISGFPDKTPYSVYNMNGAIVGKGKSGDSGLYLPNGIYIINVGGVSAKISVK